MDFDIVVATRNRYDLLAPTLRSLLAQDRLPARLIVVDSSDDPEPARTVVEQTVRGKAIESITLHTAPGLTAQRNVGLEHVQSPVVMFPDDDVIWADGAAEAVMRVYERDDEACIAGVALTEVHAPPPGYPEVAQNRKAKSLSTQLTYRLSPLRARVERLFQESPIRVRCRELTAAHLARSPAPGWLEEVRAHTVPSMTGFRMTFRTDAIRDPGFDETLRPYSLYEDNDASLTALRKGILVQAELAEVFHNRAPGRRAPRIAMGAILLLNLVYITCKHSPIDSSARGAIPKYLRMRALQYRLRATGEFGRARLEGFRRAMKHLPELLEAEGDELRTRYTRALSVCTTE